MTRLPHPWRRLALAALLAAAAGLPAAHAARLVCRDCVEVSSVKNAAGTGDRLLPELQAMLSGIEFDGDTLTPAARRQLQRLADRLRQPDAPRLVLQVRADGGLDATRARAQASTRGAALRKALLAAGAPADQVAVSP